MYKYFSTSLISMWAISLSYQLSQATAAEDSAWINISSHISQAVVPEKNIAEKLVQFIAATVSLETTENILLDGDLRGELVAKVAPLLPPMQLLAICEHINQLGDEQRRSQGFKYLQHILSNRVMSLSEMLTDGFKIEAKKYMMPYSKLKIDAPVSEEQLSILASNLYLKELELTGLFSSKGAEFLAKAVADHPTIQLVKMKPKNKADLLEYSEQFDEPAKTKLKKILLSDRPTEVLFKCTESYNTSLWNYHNQDLPTKELTSVSFEREFRSLAKDYPEIVYEALINADAEEWDLSLGSLDEESTRALALALKNSSKVKFLNRGNSRLTLPIA